MLTFACALSTSRAPPPNSAQVDAAKARYTELKLHFDHGHSAYEMLRERTRWLPNLIISSSFLRPAEPS